MKTKCRDNRVDALYELENNQLPVGREFRDHTDAQAWVDGITGTEFWTSHICLPKYVKVLSHGDLDWSECKPPNEIWLASQHLNQAVVLHELAHFFPPFDGHGRRFVRAYLGLLAQFLGISYSNEYRQAFVTHKIKF